MLMKLTPVKLYFITAYYKSQYSCGPTDLPLNYSANIVDKGLFIVVIGSIIFIMPFSLSVFCKNKWPKCKKHKRRSFCSYFIQLKCTTFYCIGFIDGHKIETNFAFFLEQSTRHDFSVRVCLSLSLFQFKSSNSVDNPIRA